VASQVSRTAADILIPFIDRIAVAAATLSLVRAVAIRLRVSRAGSRKMTPGAQICLGAGLTPSRFLFPEYRCKILAGVIMSDRR
jgi:hypothetical protein